MKTKFTKILGVSLALVLVLTMGLALLPATPAAAQAPTPSNTWAPYATPQVGQAFGFKLDPNIAALGPIVKAVNGDLYVYVTYAVAPVNRIFKSVDGGRSWVDLPNYNVQVAGGPVRDFAASSYDANVLYILDTTATGQIYRTVDGGQSFVQITAPAAAVTLSCIAVGYAGGKHYIFAGDRTGGAENAWYLDDSIYGAPWIGMLQVNAVYEIALSPNFTTEANPLVLAVVLRAAGVRVQNKYGTGAWDTAPGMGEVTLGAAAAIAAATKPCVAFVDDFDANPAGPSLEYFVSIADGGANGGIYQVFYAGVVAAPIAAGQYVSVDVDGPAYSAAIMGGTTAGAVTRSLDDGVTFLGTLKGPSLGLATAAATYVLVDEDYINNNEALALVNAGAAADAAGLARQVADRCWNQISLIDTNLGTFNDVAFSDTFSTDGTAFLSTQSLVGVADSLWKSDGTNWERVAAVLIATGIGDVQTSPFYSTDSAVYYLDRAARTTLTRSPNGGNVFIPLNNQPVAAIAGWKVIDSTKLIAGPAAAAQVYVTLNRGASLWSVYATGIVGGNFMQAFALSPDFAYGTKGDILAGSGIDAMFLSADFGQTWTLQGGGAPIAVPGAGTIYPAFADNYDSAAPPPAKTIYATSSLGGVYTTFAGGPPFTRIDNLAGAPATGAVAADTMTIGPATWVAAAAGEILSVTLSSGQISWAGLVNVNITYNVGTATYALTSVAAGAVSATATCLTAPASGVFTATTANTGGVTIAYTGTGTGSVLVAAAIGSTGNWSLPAAATTAAVANPFAVSASTGIVVADGVVYAVDVAAGEGMSRCLNPQANVLGPVADRPYFERQNTWINGTFAANTLGAGIPNGQGLQAVDGSTSLFAIDNSGAGIGFAGVFKYTEGLITGPTLTGPADGINIGNETTVLLSWADVAGALNYTVQYDTAPNFNASPLTVAPTVASQRITGLVSGSTYYWRVRVTEQLPCRTNWSATQSFITSMSASAWNPGTVPEGVAPAPGATGVSLTPSFQWNPANGATGYAFVLSANADLSSPIVDTTVTSPVYLCTTALNNATTYYWQVTALGTVSASFQFNGTFTTLAAPAAPVFTCGYCGLQFSSQAALEAHIAATHGPVEAGTPMYIWFIIGIGAVLVVAVIFLIVRTRAP